MQKQNKEKLLSVMHDKALYEALIDLLDSKLQDELSVIGQSEKDPIAKVYKLLSVDSVVGVINELKTTLAEINHESTK